MAGWPQHWRKSSDSSGYKRFLSIVRASGAGHHSLIIPKNVQLFPDKTERIESRFLVIKIFFHYIYKVGQLMSGGLYMMEDFSRYYLTC